MKSRDWRPGRRRKGSLPHYLLARPLTVCLTAAVAAAALLLALNVYLLQNVGPKGLTPKSSSSPDVHHEEYAKPRGEPHLPRPILWLHYKTERLMSHVMTVFQRLGFSVTGGPSDDWSVLWSHEYPFKSLPPGMVEGLRPHQRINHFPGSGCFTFKPQLAKLDYPFVPKAFQLPADAQQLREEAKAHPSTLWVQKSNMHRGIKVQKISAADLNIGGSFIQKFISNPILIDKRKFDIGVYTAITSVDPLRVYVYTEEVLVRFCSEDYHPFIASKPKKYVVDDEYTPSWEIPSMAKMIVEQKFSHKQSLNLVLKGKGYNSDKLWDQVNSIIQQILLHCEPTMVNYTLRLSKDSRHFFEMVRFDFVVDEELVVWLMEVNLSPNLSSAHTQPNRIMYEQVLFNLLNLVGLARATHDSFKYNGEYESVMVVNNQDIQIPLPECIDGNCQSCSSLAVCQLCWQCRDETLSFKLKAAFLEHTSRRNFRRIYPAPIADPLSLTSWPRHHPSAGQSLSNFLMEFWFGGKCKQDKSWCN